MAITLAVLSLGAYVAFEYYARASQDATFFEAEILAFEAADRVSPPGPGGIVFVGSSSIRLWSTLADDMHPLPVINRGFGGSQLSHVVHFAYRIITPYAPSAVVVYAGDNDLAERTGKTAEIVLSDFQQLVAKIRERSPQARIYFLSIKPSKLRWARWPEMARANAMIQKWCAADPLLETIDVATILLAPDGEPRDDVFRLDGLHLNETGYRAWTQIVKPILERDASRSDAAPKPPVGNGRSSEARDDRVT
jgi:lysophospholipase L1-like esterase